MKKSKKSPVSNFWSNQVSSYSNEELIQKYQEKMAEYQNAIETSYKNAISDIIRYFKKEAMKREIDLFALCA